MSSSALDIEVDFSNPALVAALRAYTLLHPRSAQARYYCQHFPNDDAACRDNGVTNFYPYRISLGASVAFAALFALSLLGFLATLIGGICVRSWRGTSIFTIALVVGVLLELLGYVGRLLSWYNPWNESPFLLQITALTLGPAFIAASLYLCLRRIVQAFGPKNSRIPPEYYTRIVSATPVRPVVNFPRTSSHLYTDQPSSSPATSPRCSSRASAAP